MTNNFSPEYTIPAQPLTAREQMMKNRRRSLRTFAGALAITTATIGTLGFGNSKEAKNIPQHGVLAYCTGEQIVTAHDGATLTGLIEDNVYTNPSERLKTNGNLELIAEAVSTSVVGTEPVIVYHDNGDVAADELMKDEKVLLPRECHLR